MKGKTEEKKQTNEQAPVAIQLYASLYHFYIVHILHDFNKIHLAFANRLHNPEENFDFTFNLLFKVWF